MTPVTSESKLRWRYFGGVMAVAAIFIALFIGTIFFVAGYFLRQSEEEYARNGIAADATVTGKDTKTERPVAGQKGAPKVTHVVRYRYQD